MIPRPDRKSPRLFVADALRSHLESLEAKQQQSGWVDYGLLFPGEKGQPLRGSTMYRRFRRLLAANGLPMLRWHDLRHSAVSIMLALGLPMQTVQRLAGQSSLEMIAKRYGHLVPELAAAELAKLEAALVST
jgi:integrase